MKRREFLIRSCAALVSLLVARSLKIFTPPSPLQARPFSPLQDGPTPLPEITALVDVLVPPDPDILDDFKGSDYHGDWIVARTLGNLGQVAAVGFLNQRADGAYGKYFLDCTPEEQLEVIKNWLREKESLNSMEKDLLSGLLTTAVIGTYEENTAEEQAVLFEAMGWFDPDDPAGTLRVPNEGYPDSFQFPAKLKKGVRNG